MEWSGYLIELPQRFFMQPGRKECLTVVIVTALMMGIFILSTLIVFIF